MGGGGRRLGVLVKYADDLVALCATREQAEEARELVAAVLDTLELRLHPEKTRIVHLARGAEGFDFLGFHHRMRESWTWRGRWYLQKWPSRPGDGLDQRQDPRPDGPPANARLPLEYAVEDVNHVVRVGGTTSATETPGRSSLTIDSYVHERLAILASAKHGLTRPKLGLPLQLRMVNQRRRLSPDRKGVAHDCVCQPVNDVGEPCAGEPHARFDAAAGGYQRQSGQHAPCGCGRLPPTLRAPRLLWRCEEGMIDMT